MKNLIKKFRLKRMDEMDKHIASIAGRNTLFFIVLALTVYTFYEGYRSMAFNEPINLIPSLILVLAVIVQNISTLVLKRMAVKDEIENLDTAPMFKLVMYVLSIVSLVVFIGYAILYLGVSL